MKDCRASGTSITIAPSPRVSVAVWRFRAFETDGAGVSGRRAVVRTLALPLSFLFLGLGFAGHPFR